MRVFLIDCKVFPVSGTPTGVRVFLSGEPPHDFEDFRQARCRCGIQHRPRERIDEDFNLVGNFNLFRILIFVGILIF